jgi:hypothetical protein
VRLARRFEVEQLEPPCCVEQQFGGFTAAELLLGDLSPKVLNPGGLQCVTRPSVDGDEQSQRRFEGAGVALRRGCRKEPPATPTRISRQHHRVLEKGGCGCEPAAREGSSSGTFQFFCDILIRPRCGLSQMPRTPVWVDLGIRDLCQSTMHHLSFPNCRRPVHRCADKRVTKHDTASKLKQTGIGGWASRLALDSEPIGCTPNQHRFADRLSGRYQRQKPGFSGKTVQPALKRLLNPLGKRG